MAHPALNGLLLLELIPDNLFRHYRSETYPFIAGLCEAAGLSCDWAAIGVPEDPSFDYRLDPADEAIVVDLVRQYGATHLLVNEHVVSEQWARLQESCEGVRFLFWGRSNLAALRDDLAEALGLEMMPVAWEGAEWLDRLTPRYLRVPANPMARELQPFVPVLAGPRCVYNRPLSGNPVYRDVDVAGCHDGCAFCGRDWTPYKVASFLDFAVRQVLQADRDLDDLGGPLPLDVHSAAVWSGLEAFVGRLHEAEVRPFVLYLSPRLDELLAAGDAMDRVLARMATRGDSIRLYTSGVESFSEGENLRLNKGLEREVVQEATARVVDWRERWPDTLDFSESQGLSAILFTPWTSLADVRDNLDHLDGNPLISADYALGTRLLLFPGRAVTRLAQKDGLIAEAFEDHAGEAGCKIEWDQEELPWRFQHPEVALLYRFVRRLSGEGRVPPEDPERMRVEAWRCGLPEAAHGIVKLTEHACAALEAASDLADLRALAAAVHRRLELSVPFRWPGEGGRILVDAAWRDRVVDAFHKVGHTNPGLLSGAVPGEITLARSGGVPVLRLAFRGVDDRDLVLWMQDADVPCRSYVDNSAVSVWYDGSTPLDAPWMEDVVRLAARMAQRLAP